VDCGGDTFPDTLFVVDDKLQDMKRALAAQSRTAEYWLLYLYYVSVLKMFLRAERCGDWHLQIASIRQMVHLFAAMGHRNYAKCAHLYVEQMTELPTSHPEVYQQFVSGRHAVHQSNKFWTGISVDLSIEQAMMRAIKGKGGVMHGRGASESVRSTWISTVHKTAGVKTALSNLADIEYCHDVVQHPELGKSRARRDNVDLVKMLDFFRCHNPFDSSDSRLRCLTSGITAVESDGINCDKAEEVGANIVRWMDGMPFSAVSLRRKDQVWTLAQVTSVCNANSNKRIGTVDPTVLFNCLLVIMQRSANMQKYFGYELSPQPTSLFKDNYMQKTEKAQLAKEICKDCLSAVVPCGTRCVVDGCYLLRAVVWTKGSTYGDVCYQYVHFVRRNFGSSADVVFDGYGTGASTKDYEHKRRATRCSPDIVVDRLKTAYHDQSSFLCNDANKSVHLLLC